jgi:cbb3-type cytochrome oxidase subunit 3
MGMSFSSDKEISIQKAQRTIEYGLGVAVPSFLSLMMFSYVLLPVLYQVFMGLSILTAILMLVPAKRMHELSYECWSKDTMPRTIITSLLGIIYITEVSVFAVSMLSFYEGLDPEQPLTFAVLALLIMCLIGVMAYSDKNKERFDRTYKLMVRMDSEKARKKVGDVLQGNGHEFVESMVGKNRMLDISSHGLVIDLKPLTADTTEVFLTVNDGGNDEKADGLRAALLSP